MKIIIVNQWVFTYFLIIFHASRAATHWIVTEDGKIHTQDDSVYQLRRPYDLMSLLQQEKRADVFTKIKGQLMVQKEEIETDNMSDNDDDVEHHVYLTNKDCIRAGKPLVKFDLYVGTIVFAYPKSALLSSDKSNAFPDGFPIHQLYAPSSMPSVNNLYYSGNKSLFTIACANTSNVKLVDDLIDDWDSTDDDVVQLTEIESSSTESLADRAKFGPNCSEYLTLDFSMTSFEHLPSIRDRKQLHIDPEHEIYRFVGKWKTYEEFGTDINNGLKQNSSSWILYTLASFYWRGAGNAEQAIECARRALHTSPPEYRQFPQLSLATILHRARALEEAAIVLHGAIDITPDIPHAHYTLGNIYATLADYNKSITCYENVQKLTPLFAEALVRKAAVLCHSNIENALKAQHDTLQKTLEELKDYQKQQELWINYHKKLRAEQAPPSMLLEQRLHYREFKIRQKLEAMELDDSLNDNVNKSPKNPDSKDAAIDPVLVHEDLYVIPMTEQMYFKFSGELGTGSLSEKIIAALDNYEKMAAELACQDGDETCRKAVAAKLRDDSLSDSSVSSANNESNEEDSKGGSGTTAGSSSSNKNNKRHVPLGTNSKY